MLHPGGGLLRSAEMHPPLRTSSGAEPRSSDQVHAEKPFRKRPKTRGRQAGEAMRALCGSAIVRSQGTSQGSLRKGRDRTGRYLQLGALRLPLGSLGLEAAPLVLQEMQDAWNAVLSPRRRGRGRHRRRTPSHRRGRGRRSRRGRRLPRLQPRPGPARRWRQQQRVIVVVAEEDAGPRLLVHGRSRRRGRSPPRRPSRGQQPLAPAPSPSPAPAPKSAASQWRRRQQQTGRVLPAVSA